MCTFTRHLPSGVSLARGLPPNRDPGGSLRYLDEPLAKIAFVTNWASALKHDVPQLTTTDLVNFAIQSGAPRDMWRGHAGAIERDELVPCEGRKYSDARCADVDGTNVVHLTAAKIGNSEL